MYAAEWIYISQPAHIDSLVELLSQKGCNSNKTPYLDDISTDPLGDDESARPEIATVYSKAVGEIRYIADSARPDVSYAAHTLAKALKTSTLRHWNLLQRTAQYLHTTREEGISMPKANKRRIDILAYSDADCVNDKTSRKWIRRMVTLFNGVPVHWLARQQPVVAKSTCEADYISASEATKHTF